MAIKPKKVKLSPRAKRKIRIRKKLQVAKHSYPRLCVFRSCKHTYGQLIDDLTGKVIASASTKDKEVLKEMESVKTEDLHNNVKSTKSVVAAKAVGALIGKRAKEHSVDKIVFDRNGYLYHGRVKAMADGARQAGLDF
ncbi:MAG: 50S ribosomal protein L18 [Deltaproteobacteria bacterium]|nr:50S ribosomal protein L18 [Deltaproteobacteria bacterium]